MSDFFKSEMVRGELQEITELQQFCVRSVQTFPALSPDKRLDYFFKLKTLIEKQQIFWARLKLSDDPQAKVMIQNLRAAAVMFGAEDNDNLEGMFKELLTKIDMMTELARKEAEGG